MILQQQQQKQKSHAAKKKCYPQTSTKRANEEKYYSLYNDFLNNKGLIFLSLESRSAVYVSVGLVSGLRDRATDFHVSLAKQQDTEREKNAVWLNAPLVGSFLWNE